ncbi:phosphate ABC transporter permease [Aureibaculum sp. A20]|uniref:Phosphate ABC transporter permease n=1 Tax=Aureibaculum flavum TaxID=2795986 RepID=A0ABS0WR24_9FLAO|nr:phosphate ABC transporter permease [Aureibaculum flavum]MBJ2174430.1 phosphate ABC transporter permease [Aureibaculum flavum]
MKFILLTLLTFTCNVMFSQNTELEDLWSGKYRMEPLGKPLKEKDPKQYYTIKKIKDKNEDDVAGRYEADLERWAITQDVDISKDEEELRRFLFNEEDNEYEQFNWSELHKKGKMKCIDGGNLFICKTTPKTTVSIDDESFYSNSGIFAVVLHYGVFEFYKESN